MKKTVTNQLNIQVRRESFLDEGDGLVTFPGGLTITDNSVQRNGTRYDIDSMDLSKYGQQITADHQDTLSNIIAKAVGTHKSGDKVVLDSIQYAINESPYGRLAYNLLVNGFSNNFSIETIGTPPDETGTYYGAELVGLSQVVVPNNYNATANLLVHNSLKRSKELDGLDVEGIEETILKEQSVEETQKHETDTVAVKEEETKELKTPEVETPATEVETPKHISETEEVKETPEIKENHLTEAEAIDETKQIVAEEPVTLTPAKVEQVETPAPTVEEEKVVPVVEEVENTAHVEEEKEIKENKMTEKKTEGEVSTVDNAANLAEAIKLALAPVMEELASVKAEAKNAFDRSAKEPEFKEVETKEVAKNSYADMAFRERNKAQVDAAWNAVKLNSIEDWKTLQEINAVNLEALKKEGIAENSISLSDLGNFVISPELYNEIVGHRNNYTALLNATEWKETLSLQFAWTKRVGDIDMQPVDLEPGNDGNGNLKPISEYGTSVETSNLEELAAVTVVCNSTTRFAAVDLLSDAAQGYRTDYDRKRAQLIIAKLEDAVDETGNSVAYAPVSDVDALNTLLDAATDISDVTLQGTYVFNARTLAKIKSQVLKAGVSGPLSEVFTTGTVPTIFGQPYVVVPNDLMPSLGNSTPVVHYVDGAPKTINHAIFFADLGQFTGRTSGGLQYDVSNSAAYEENGVTKSAYQRNELVLRGSFYRGGAIKDVSFVAGIRQGAGANVS